MSRKKEITRISIVFVILFTGCFVATPVTVESRTEPFFTLVAKTSGPNNFDILNFITQHLARIGIKVILKHLEWPFFIYDVFMSHNYDLCHVSWVGGEGDPDWTGVYNENGTLNVAGYDISMDWDEELGTGKNEWYMKQGRLIMPPHSEERISHYWAWEQHLMDNILPMLPTFTPEVFTVMWSNLKGYDISDDLKTTWGKLSWDGMHQGQENTLEIVISEGPWIQLNPLFDFTFPSANIPNKVMDSLVTQDRDLNFYPHLAKSWEYLNDTHLRIELRQNIKWQTDPDGLFPNEYFDADDVLFSYYVYGDNSDYSHTLSWLEDIKKVDQYTVDFFIDQDSSTPENEPFAPFFRSFLLQLVPEHYLNQSQLADGKTPDYAHSSWLTFATHCFGTSLFEMDPLYNPVETNLLLFEDCWLLDPSVDKSNMDFDRRFGNFSSGINKLKIRTVTDVMISILELESGNLDVIRFGGNLGKRDEFLVNPNFSVYEEIQYFYSFLGYNMREDRPDIGSREPAPGDPSITKGLAIRKAISYAIDRQEINNVLFGGERIIQHYPIYHRMSKWCNPNIIRYNHNLDLAREYMRIAGFGELDPPKLDPWEITGIVLVSAFITGVIVFTFFKIKKK